MHRHLAAWNAQYPVDDPCNLHVCMGTCIQILCICTRREGGFNPYACSTCIVAPSCHAHMLHARTQHATKCVRCCMLSTTFSVALWTPTRMVRGYRNGRDIATCRRIVAARRVNSILRRTNQRNTSLHLLMRPPRLARHHGFLQVLIISVCSAELRIARLRDTATGSQHWAVVREQRGQVPVECAAWL